MMTGMRKKILTRGGVLHFELLSKGALINLGFVRYNIYESAVAITSPLKTITGPLKKIKIAKKRS